MRLPNYVIDKSPTLINISWYCPANNS